MAWKPRQRGVRGLDAHGGWLLAGGGLVCALTLTSCLSATPPKTPNQREAERHAPRVVVPPPTGERTPRPAPVP